MQAKVLFASALLAVVGFVAWWSAAPGEGVELRGVALPKVEAAPSPDSLRPIPVSTPAGARREGIARPEVPATPPSEARLTVRVIEAGSARPLARVRVVVYETGVARAARPIDGPDGDLLRSPQTDRLGRASVDLPAARPLRLSLRGDRVDAADASLVLAPLVEGEQRELVVALEARAAVPCEALIIDAESGAPIAGAELRRRHTEPGPATAWTVRGVPSAISEERGRATLARPAGQAATYQVDARGYGPATFRVSGEETGAARTVRLSRAAQVELRLDGAVDAAALLARVHCPPGEVDRGGGNFAAGAELEWVEPFGRDGRVTVTGLPAHAALQLEVLDERGELVVPSSPLRLAPAEARVIELDLAGGVHVFGALAGADGAPIPDQELWLVPAARRGPANLASRESLRAVHTRTRTDGLGRFSLRGVPHGDWCLGPAPALRPGSTELAPLGQWFHAPQELEELELNVRTCAGVYLAGRVLDPDGAAAGHAALTYRGLGDATPLYAQTDQHGAFALGPLPPGAYELRAQPDRRGAHAGSAPELVVAGEAPIDLHLRSGVALPVSAVQGEDGRLVPLTTAFVTRTDGEPILAAVHRSSYGATRLELGPLEPGTYTVVAGTASGRFGIAQGVIVGAGEGETLLTLGPGARLVLDNRGDDPLAVRVRRGSAIVEALTLDPGQQSTLWTVPGDLTLEVEGGAREVRERRIRVQPGGSATLTLPGN